ncbi:LuxR C-terminal-related transcriptional regulator [Bradyrhizobium xenonodulans]|uniref:LuxR C-terminal-related transcriptional regulator n=1 Tax=Bradyrhizobium xenonodulans TaxID=2736875 RepID=A0ABY7MUN6_9BRAD|nr:LuxR C-terminal-related transcriptional regulator [Bradyrhizobium xenonodulans]WBL82132.1 LuxR C-terminal-related transcriptional regulator [Bradyrhizobium xenonodulans]
MILRERGIFAPLILQGPVGSEPLTPAGSEELAFFLAHMTQAAAIFGLTPAETRVALAVGSETVGGEAANYLNLSQNTVKTHPGNIFAKTGTRGQVELARLLTIIGQLGQRRAPPS